MIQDNDESVLKNQEKLNTFYRAVESQVKTFFLSKQVTYKIEFKLEYIVKTDKGCLSHIIAINPEYNVWMETPLIDLYNIYLNEAWSKLLSEIENIDISNICVIYNRKYKNYHNWLEEIHRNSYINIVKDDIRL